jgi:hypothetical protein
VTVTVRVKPEARQGPALGMVTHWHGSGDIMLTGPEAEAAMTMPPHARAVHSLRSQVVPQCTVLLLSASGTVLVKVHVSGSLTVATH